MTPPDATGWYGRGRPGPAIKIVLLGDSSAAGYGVERVEETPGALLASGAAERANRRVYLRAFAKIGARSADLAGQLDRALPIEPDVAVILIGANDVTHRVRPAASVGDLAEAVRRLKEAGVAVAGRHLPRPGHRQADPARRSSRWPAPGRGGWPRPRRSPSSRAAAGPSRSGSVLGPEFAAAPALMFGPDRFHPSAAGYRSLAARAGSLDARGARPHPRRRGGSRGAAAARASCRSPPRRCRRSTPPAPSSTAPRSPAGRAASAASGSSCGTAAGSRSPRARRPARTRARTRARTKEPAGTSSA